MAFSRDKACCLVGEALKLISRRYPPGALDWLKDNKPDVIAQIKDAERAIDAAILSDDAKPFPVALERFITLHTSGFKAYTVATGVTCPPPHPPAPSRTARPPQ